MLCDDDNYMQVHIVDDDALLSTALDSVSSTKVRKRMLAGADARDMVGSAVNVYIIEHKIADKVAGRLQWTDDDKEPVTFDVMPVGPGSR